MNNIDLKHGNCLELMKEIPDNSIDMVLTDLPYGTTSCKWDCLIDLKLLWIEYNRLIKNNGAILLFGSEPFSSILRMSNLNLYRYDWIWNKVTGANFIHAYKMPFKIHENIMVFYKSLPKYNPIMTDADLTKNRPWNNGIKANRNIFEMASGIEKPNIKRSKLKRLPKSIITYNRMAKECNTLHRLHPTQKPIDLLEYLILTYTDENDIILDNTMGSGSTGVAAKKTGRNFIGIEKDEKYFNIAKERIQMA